jgi:hypothetical protein
MFSELCSENGSSANNLSRFSTILIFVFLLSLQESKQFKKEHRRYADLEDQWHPGRSFTAETGNSHPPCLSNMASKRKSRVNGCVGGLCRKDCIYFTPK